MKKPILFTTFFLIVLARCVLSGEAPKPDLKPLVTQLETKKENPLQVFIEVNIFEVLVTNADDIGFVYDLIGEIGEFRGSNLTGDDTIESNLGVLPGGSRESLLPAGANIKTHIYDDSEGAINAVFQALSEDQIIKVHANPILFTLDGQKASLTAGDDIPFLSRTGLANIETVVTNFTSTGVNLTLTPTIKFFETDIQRKNPFIEIEIDTSLSTVTRYRDEQGFAQPIVDSRQYTSTVRVKTGNRILIGALFRDFQSNSTRGIPIMKDIPLLGRLFRSTSTESGISQLYIMIRPFVIDIWEKGIDQSVTEQEENAKRLRKMLEKRAEQFDSEPSPLLEQFRQLFLDHMTPE